MKIFRNGRDAVGVYEKFFKYIECELPVYLISKRYVTYARHTNHVWFSELSLSNVISIPNNTSLQDLINGT